MNSILLQFWSRRCERMHEILRTAILMWYNFEYLLQNSFSTFCIVFTFWSTSNCVQSKQKRHPLQETVAAFVRLHLPTTLLQHSKFLWQIVALYNDHFHPSYQKISVIIVDCWPFCEWGASGQSTLGSTNNGSMLTDVVGNASDFHWEDVTCTVKLLQQKQTTRHSSSALHHFVQIHMEFCLNSNGWVLEHENSNTPKVVERWILNWVHCVHLCGSMVSPMLTQQSCRVSQWCNICNVHVPAHISHSFCSFCSQTFLFTACNHHQWQKAFSSNWPCNEISCKASSSKEKTARGRGWWDHKRGKLKRNGMAQVHCASTLPLMGMSLPWLHPKLVLPTTWQFDWHHWLWPSMMRRKMMQVQCFFSMVWQLLPAQGINSQKNTWRKKWLWETEQRWHATSFVWHWIAPLRHPFTEDVMLLHVDAKLCIFVGANHPACSSFTNCGSSDGGDPVVTANNFNNKCQHLVLHEGTVVENAVLSACGSADFGTMISFDANANHVEKSENTSTAVTFNEMVILCCPLLRGRSDDRQQKTCPLCTKRNGETKQAQPAMLLDFKKVQVDLCRFGGNLGIIQHWVKLQVASLETMLACMFHWDHTKIFAAAPVKNFHHWHINLVDEDANNGMCAVPVHCCYLVWQKVVFCRNHGRHIKTGWHVCGMLTYVCIRVW